jgi:Flp pilus assembly pilin Flp
MMELGKNYLLHTGVETMRRKQKLNHNGQNLIEYAIIVALIASAMIAMSTYVFRSVQATQQVIQKGYSD